MTEYLCHNSDKPLNVQKGIQGFTSRVFHASNEPFMPNVVFVDSKDNLVQALGLTRQYPTERVELEDVNPGDRLILQNGAAVTVQDVDLAGERVCVDETESSILFSDLNDGVHRVREGELLTTLVDMSRMTNVGHMDRMREGFNQVWVEREKLGVLPDSLKLQLHDGRFPRSSDVPPVRANVLEMRNTAEELMLILRTREVPVPVGNVDNRFKGVSTVAEVQGHVDLLLSPEFLSADGERSRSEQARVRNRVLADARARVDEINRFHLSSSQ